MILPDHFLFKAALIEHNQFYAPDLQIVEEEITFMNSVIQYKGYNYEDYCCFKIDNNGKPITSYYIGTDWVDGTEVKAVYIQPKLNKEKAEQVDYLKMLFSLLQDQQVAEHLDEIYEVKWDSKQIPINRQLDLLTPLIIVQFLQVVYRIVRKGLKKSYYDIDANLFGKIKGKVMLSATIKKNLLKNKSLNNICRYQEFGINGLENRLIKMALVFVQRYIGSTTRLNTNLHISQSLNYILPAFEGINESVNLHDIKQSKVNAFYKDYQEGIKLSKLILKRFSYNITNANNSKSFPTPPFWIDMSKLFELYTLGLLRKAYGNKILYGGKQAKGFYGLPDYLFTEKGAEKVIDAKYKPIYQEKRYDIDNIRQVAGYARDNKILEKLNIESDVVVDCVIIYPNNLCLEDSEKYKIDLQKARKIDQFRRFYRLGIPLPVIKVSAKP